ncbi:MAG TPA: ABC transporter substrate-binding protein [Candidatus Paceibacterota bacterium]|nr:ABC transporter substrate-binding protein [Candidatus Paceibacterota bacterium]HOL54148.1 ABC transporter substrate-binding protein [Candidatus Paceibacterota bacterium]HON21976.1 ABC transporter substrate-binding protein [Candidatus Paceibacterota bacterium]
MSKTTKTILWIIVAIIVIGLVWYAVSKKSETVTKEEETIKIGAVLPLSGNLASLGEATKSGLMAAQEKINNTNSGWRVEIIFEDSQSNAQVAVTAVQKLINIDKVNALAVYGSQFAYATAPIAQENKIVQLSYLMDSQLAKNYNYSVVFFPTYETEVSLMADYILKNDIDKIGILHSNIQAHQNASDFLVSELKKQNYTDQNFHIEVFSPGQVDIKTQLIKLKGYNPKIIAIFSTPAEVVSIVKQIKELGLDTTLLFNSAPSVIAEMDQSKMSVFEGSLFVLFNTTVSQSVDQMALINDLKSKGEVVTAPETVVAYDSLCFLTEAFKKAKNQADVINQLRGASGIGLSGKITITNDGVAHFEEMKLGIVKNGKIELYEDKN